MPKNTKGKAQHRNVEEFKSLEMRTRIAKMYCEGKPLHAIATVEGTTLQNVSYHLKIIREYWASLMLANYDERVAELLARTDNLETRAWESFEKSCQNAETIKEVLEQGIRMVPGKGKGSKPIAKLMPTKKAIEKMSKGQAGDPRFLQIVADCIDRRAKLMGITDERPVSNVFLNFDTLISQQPKPVDVIEQVISQVGQQSNISEVTEQPQQTQLYNNQELEQPHNPTIGLKELPGTNGESNGTSGS